MSEVQWTKEYALNYQKGSRQILGVPAHQHGRFTDQQGYFHRLVDEENKVQGDRATGLARRLREHSFSNRRSGFKTV